MEKSRFGINLFLQMVLCAVLGFVASHFQYSEGFSSLHQILMAIYGILMFSIWFGIIYAFFRLFGARGGVIERFYQNFPISGAKSEAASGIASEVTQNSAPQKGFDWDQVFSAHYLRYAGMLMVLSAVFSLLFRIEWALEQKTLAAFALAGLSLFIAEFLRGKNSRSSSAVALLVSFAAIQFGTSLAAKLCVTNGHAFASDIGSYLLCLKAALTVAYIPLLFRYGSNFSAVIYFAIAYLGPVSMRRLDIPVDFFWGAVYVLALSGLSLWRAFETGSWGLALLNAAAAHLSITALFGPRWSAAWGIAPEDTAVAAPTLALLFGVYALHLITTVFIELKDQSKETPLEFLHSFAVHVNLMFGVSFLIRFIPSLENQTGVMFLLLSLLPLSGHFYIQSTTKRETNSSGLLHMAVLMSALGLFTETKGPWSAAVFLLYSSILLWYSLVRRERSMRIFSFVILTASLFKLYTECDELFDSISGSAVVMVLGVILLVLANKMEKLKEIFGKNE